MIAAPAPGAHPADPALFRQVLGNFCSGVTVVAALGPGGPLGLTCQSFASLSLDPPLIMFSPARTSATWPRIRDLGRFCVSILAEEHEQVSAQMSRSGSDKFAGVRWHRTPLGAPWLEGAAAWLDCTLEAAPCYSTVAATPRCESRPSRSPDVTGFRETALRTGNALQKVCKGFISERDLNSHARDLRR